MVEQWKAVGLNVVIEMKENWAQILGRFPGRGICENSNSSWFNDPVASLSAYAPGGQTWEAGQWENDEMIGLTAALQDSTDLQKRRADFRRMLTILEREAPATTSSTRTRPSPPSAATTNGARRSPSSSTSGRATGGDLRVPPSLLMFLAPARGRG